VAFDNSRSCSSAGFTFFWSSATSSWPRHSRSEEGALRQTLPKKDSADADCPYSGADPRTQLQVTESGDAFRKL
jgi:hypothetical protein